MSALDRAALIEAIARECATTRHWASLALDAALPLIADAIASSRIEMYDEAPPGTVTYDFAVNVKAKAAELVRSLLAKV